MILVCGHISEPVTELVCARLEAENLAYRVLNPTLSREAAIPSTLHVEYFDGDVSRGWFRGESGLLSIDDLTGVYFRPVLRPSDDLPGLSPDAAQALQAQRAAALAAVLDALPCPVVNPVFAGISNNSKPHQAMLIRAAGFSVPETLVTNDPAAALAFAAEFGGDVIFKSLSGVRSIVRRFDARQAERLPLLRHGPAQFQRRIAGCDVRVHVVGDDVFATRIDTASIDYRYASRDGQSIDMQPATLPDDVAQRCIALTRQLGLLVAGIDLKQSSDGEYFCFEANPSPGFLFYERITGQPISTAIAHLLAGKRLPTNSRQG